MKPGKKSNISWKQIIFFTKSISHRNDRKELVIEKTRPATFVEAIMSKM